MLERITMLAEELRKWEAQVGGGHGWVGGWAHDAD